MPANDISPPSATAPTCDPISRALEATLSRNALTVERIARQHGLTGPDVDEVVQDVRIRLWRALPSGERIADVSASYLYRTATSAARDLLRRRRARLTWESRAAPLEPSSRDQAEVASERIEIAERIAGALSLLAESRRRVVGLHLAGFHRTEIARLFGWSEARTRHLLYRGLADLRARLRSVISDQ